MRFRVAATIALLLASCNQSPPDREQPLNQAAPTAPVPGPTPSSAIDLSGYEGKYASDKVDGVDFLHQSPVVAAIQRSGAPEEVRRFILAADGPQTPIARQGLMLTAWGCEAHNCGPHNWAVQVGTDGSGGAVCYLDEDSGQPPRWYADGKLQDKQESCD